MVISTQLRQTTKAFDWNEEHTRPQKVVLKEILICIGRNTPNTISLMGLLLV